MRITTVLLLIILVSCGGDGGGSSSQTCSELGGNICSSSQTCSGSWLSVSDTEMCCSEECELPVCTENWQCTDWSECINETQTRTCADANSCGTTTGKPSESQSCEEEEEEGPESGIYSNKIAVTSKLSGDLDIWTLNPDGTEMVNITNSPPTSQNPLGLDADPAWSPDSTKIAFISSRTGEGEIWIMDADGSNPRDLTNDPDRWDIEPEWSPDGQKIAYISNEEGGTGGAEISIINTDGTNRVQLTNNDYDDAYPVFSPNGEMIVFHSDKGKIPIGECSDPIKGTVTKYANEIYLMDLNGNNVVQLTNMGRSTRGISWSPDGTQFVYTSNEGCDPGEIYTMDVGNLMNVDLSTLTSKSPEELKNMEELEYLTIAQLTDNPSGPDTNPSFSPDGTKIVWQSIREGAPGGNELYVMNGDGSNVTRITYTNALEKDPDWMR